MLCNTGRRGVSKFSLEDPLHNWLHVILVEFDPSCAHNGPVEVSGVWYCAVLSFLWLEVDVSEGKVHINTLINTCTLHC